MSLQFEQPFAEMQAGQTSGGLVANDTFSSKWTLISDLLGSPILYVDDAGVSKSIKPGGVVDVEVLMINKAEAIIDPLNPDTCNPAGKVSAGYEYKVTADPSWTDSVTKTNCLGVQDSFFGAGSTAEHEFSFTAPSTPSSETVDVTVETVGRGIGGTETFSVAIVEDGDPREEDPIETPNGDDGGFTLPLIGQLSSIEAAGIGGGLALLLVLLIALR